MAATPTPQLYREIGLPGSCAFFANVGPSDSVVFDHPTRKIMLGGAGTLAIRMMNGSTITLTGLAVGVFHEIVCDKILLTGTTATNIVRGW